MENSRMPQLYTDKTALQSLVSEAWQGTTLTDPNPLLRMPQSFSACGLDPSLLPLTEGESIGCQAVSGSGIAFISQEQSGPPIVSAEIRSSWQRLAEPAYLSHRGEYKKPNTQEDPVSLNRAAAPQAKEASLSLKPPPTPSAEKGLSKQNGELKMLLRGQQKDGTPNSCLMHQVPTEHSTNCASQSMGLRDR